MYNGEYGQGENGLGRKQPSSNLTFTESLRTSPFVILVFWTKICVYARYAKLWSAQAHIPLSFFAFPWIILWSAPWVKRSITGLMLTGCVNKSGLIKGSEDFWLIIQSQIVVRITQVLILKCFATFFQPHNALLHVHSVFLIPQCLVFALMRM